MHIAYITRNSATADKPRDAFLWSMQRRGLFFFIEYATSAGHYKNMYTHRNEKKT